MARKNKRAGGRKHDTRLSFVEISKLLGLTPKQRIFMRRFILKVGEQKDKE